MRFGKTRKEWVLAAFAIMALAHDSRSFAQECIGTDGVVFERVGTCGAPLGGGGGHDVPVPLGLSDKAELADGEHYLLIGRIVVLPKIPDSREPRVYFEVDLDEHPWLASAKRIANPRYPLEGSAAIWQQYDARKVKLSCRARGRIMRINDKLEYVISLQGVQPTSRDLSPRR